MNSSLKEEIPPEKEGVDKQEMLLKKRAMEEEEEEQMMTDQVKQLHE